MKGNEVGGACSLHGRDEKFIQKCSQKTWREEIIWGPGHRGEEILKLI